MSSTAVATLVHAAGFGAGIALYAMLAAMTWRDVAGNGRVTGRDRIPFVTAVLGLLWNVGALFIYGGPDLGADVPAPALVAVAFSALGFLPAVLVHAALHGSARRGAFLLTSAAYGLSTAGAALHVWAAATGGALPSRPALLLLTGGYGVLLLLLALRLRRQPAGRGALSGVALAAFAVMALHLSHHAGETTSLAMELVGHHASLPLALVIAYQDYRFALADLFLKRVLALVTLVAVALAAYLVVGAPLILPRLSADVADPRATAELLLLVVTIALVYPALRRVTAAFVDRVVLRRPNYSLLRQTIESQLAALDQPEQVLSAVCDALTPALAARSVAWRPAGEVPAAGAGHRQTTTTVVVATADARDYALEIGALTGGRRLLSDDVALIEWVARTAARRVDALRVAQERFDRRAREQELSRLTTEAELRALRAQLNPHFLFNALTTIGHLIRESPDRALHTLYRLTDLLRAVLRRSAGEFVTLGEEMEIVDAYLGIERARFEERLRVTVDVATELRGYRIPPLVLQPIVENAVKHGIAPLKAGGEVLVHAWAELGGAGQMMLRVRIADTGAGFVPGGMWPHDAAGVGLANVERRLAHYYGDAGGLVLVSAPGAGTSVELCMPVASPEYTSDRTGARSGDRGGVVAGVS